MNVSTEFFKKVNLLVALPVSDVRLLDGGGGACRLLLFGRTESLSCSLLTSSASFEVFEFIGTFPSEWLTELSSVIGFSS